MSEVTINPNPAQQVTADLSETFDDFANKVAKTSKRQIRFGNGEPIEIEPGGKYAVLALKLAEIATPEQFFALMNAIEQAIVKATMDGTIPPGWFQGVSTLFDLLPPEVPEQFQDENHEIRAYWVGEHRFVYTQTPISEEEPISQP